MRRKKRRTFCAKAYLYKKNRYLCAMEEYDLWYAKEDASDKLLASLSDEEVDEWFITDKFQLWKTIVETGCMPDRYGPRKVDDDDDEKFMSIAYLGFRPNHPKTVKYRRWLKRLAKKKNLYSILSACGGNHFYWNGDDSASMAEYYTILKGFKRFLKANKLYKIESIRKGYEDMKTYFRKPKLYIKDYKRCVRVWHTLADSED